MRRSPVAGISGSIRAVCLSKADLTAAERHGKRLDVTSKARAISKDPPITSTGLDLWKLYRKHVRDAFVPKCNTVAKHVIIQFPKDLVDGENPQHMLHHARRIVETIFNEQSIFADRIDRDEQGRHIVDIFVAPKYIKKTKKTSRLAVSVSVHEEALAEKHNRSNSSRGRGQAMQDAIFAYFRDEMKLPGVQRGDPKANPGPDWKSAEELRKEELESMKAEAEEGTRKVAEQEKSLQQLVEQAAAERDAAALERKKAQRDRDQAERERAFAEQLRYEADRLKQEAERARISIELERQSAEEALRQKNAEIERRQADLKTLFGVASEELRKAAADSEAARRNRVASEAAINEARASISAVQAERASFEQERKWHYAQLSLLARAADDRNGLELREGSDGVRMDRSRMSEDEKAAVASPLPSAIVTMARALAKALERVRQALADLASKEKKLDEERVKVEERKRQLAAEREQHDAAVQQHTAAIADLERRMDYCAAKERQLEEAIDQFGKSLESARARQAKVQAAEKTHTDWLEAVRLINPALGQASLNIEGKVIISAALAKTLPPSVASTLKQRAPDWVIGFVNQGQLLAGLKKQAAADLAESEKRAEAIAADRRQLEQSRRILDDVVAGRCVATMDGDNLCFSYREKGQPPRVSRFSRSKLEPTMVHLLEHHVRIATVAAEVSSLQAELKAERETLAKEHPERALELQRDQERTAQRVARVISPPPEWGQSHGR